MKSTRFLALATLMIALSVHSSVVLFSVASPQRDTLPAQISDDDFWKMIADFSETDGAYKFENFIANETSVQTVIPSLRRLVAPGGVYLGVAPEQNFTYMAALRSKMGFIIDIRRQNMLELLMYKAVFDLSPTRADFVGRLFSRTRPSGLTGNTSISALFTAYESAPAASVSENLQMLRDVLTKHGSKLSADDLSKIDYVYTVFSRGGPKMTSGFASTTPGGDEPSYKELMTATDGEGTNWSYLATEGAYQYVRDLQRKNLIIPLVGDFSGPKAIRSVAEYLKDHSATVAVFYLSNVETYLNPGRAGEPTPPEPKMPLFYANLAALPGDASSMLIRYVPNPSLSALTWWDSSRGHVTTVLTPMSEAVDLFKADRVPVRYGDALRMTKDPQTLVFPAK